MCCTGLLLFDGSTSGIWGVQLPTEYGPDGGVAGGAVNRSTVPSPQSTKTLSNCTCATYLARHCWPQFGGSAVSGVNLISYGDCERSMAPPSANESPT